MKTYKFAILVLATICIQGVAQAAESEYTTQVTWLKNCDPSNAQPQGLAPVILTAIAVAIGEKVIVAGVNLAAESIKAAGETKTYSTTATTMNQFYTLRENTATLAAAKACLVVMRGKLKPPKDIPKLDDKEVETIDFLDAKFSEVIFRMHAELKTIPSTKFFQLQPVRLDVSDFETNVIFSSDERDFVIAPSITVLGATESSSGILTFKGIKKGTAFKKGDWELDQSKSTPIQFPEESADAKKAMAKQSAVIAPVLLAIDILSPDDPKPATPDDVYLDPSVQTKLKAVCTKIVADNKDNVEKFQLNDPHCDNLNSTPTAKDSFAIKRDELDTALEAANKSTSRNTWAKGVCPSLQSSECFTSDINGTPVLKDIDNGPTFTYVTTSLVFSETREGNKFFAILGDALKSSDAGKVLAENILPKTQAQKKTLADALDNDNSALALAKLEYQAALDDFNLVLADPSTTQSDWNKANIALLKAKIELNQAYRKLGLTSPYPVY